jgi:hypothetical protein
MLFLKAQKSVLQVQLFFGIKKKAGAFKGSVGRIVTGWGRVTDHKGRLRFSRQVSIIIQRISISDQFVVQATLILAKREGVQPNFSVKHLVK